jgi:hypothetical protein
MCHRTIQVEVHDADVNYPAFAYGAGHEADIAC